MAFEDDAFRVFPQRDQRILIGHPVGAVNSNSEEIKYAVRTDEKRTTILLL